MWIRTLAELRHGAETIPANTALEVEAHVGRVLIRRGKAETITLVDEDAMRAVLTPDKAPQKSVEN